MQSVSELRTGISSSIALLEIEQLIPVRNSDLVDSSQFCKSFKFPFRKKNTFNFYLS